MEAYEDAIGRFRDTIFRRLKIRRDLAGDFEQAVRSLVLDCIDRNKRASLPDKLPRKYVPRQDQIITFLREEWSPWIKEGLLTRTMLRQHDPRASMALSNWLRFNTLPDDLPILTKSEAIDRELETFGIGTDVGEARKRAHRLYTVAQYRGGQKHSP